MKIEIDNEIIECNIQYEKRKKILISIDVIGFITVKVPKNTSEETIINVVRQNVKFIKDNRDKISKIQEKPKIKVYDEQGKFFHLGKACFLHELIDTSGLDEEELKVNLKKFYISSCKKIVGERIKIYQQQLKVSPKIIEIVEDKNKWGSCSSNKKITFNYRLAMVPVEIIDYVIVHELCHLLHMNHDRSFWRRVGSVLSDYKKREEFLAKYGHYMTI